MLDELAKILDGNRVRVDRIVVNEVEGQVDDDWRESYLFSVFVDHNKNGWLVHKNARPNTYYTDEGEEVYEPHFFASLEDAVAVARKISANRTINGWSATNFIKNVKARHESSKLNLSPQEESARYWEILESMDPDEDLLNLIARQKNNASRIQQQ